MKSKRDLENKLREIDHKSYKLYKDLRGSYDFKDYELCIDHVQGDPFATPSRVRLVFDNRNNFPDELFSTKERKVALEDYLLRCLHRALRAGADGGNRGGGHGRGGGSGKSGLVACCPVGQEVLERTAVLVDKEKIEVRIEVGFPAYGRSIASQEMRKILFERIPDATVPVFSYADQNKKRIAQVVELADDQAFIRSEIEKLGLVSFIADGSILPRESGVSTRPMKDGKPFEAPESMAVTLKLPHRGELRGMGIEKGITLIAGGGYHGKSTLLKAIEMGVYNHIAGDGREYVITVSDAAKIRAEEGRNIPGEDISMFINHLPSGTDTTCFSTSNASGSTSQAANTIEALCGGSRLLLIDEDTSATNFMVRDETMAKLVPEESEPITPFIRCITSLSRDCGVSSILVVGSSGEYLSVADRVVQMDCYAAKDVTNAAKQLAKPYEGKKVSIGSCIKKNIKKQSIEKAKMHGWDTITLDKTEIDLRYFDQIADAGQTAALAYMMQYALENYQGTAVQIAERLYEKIESDGFISVIPSYYGTGAPVFPRRHEFLSCLLRYRRL